MILTRKKDENDNNHGENWKKKFKFHKKKYDKGNKQKIKR